MPIELAERLAGDGADGVVIWNRFASWFGKMRGVPGPVLQRPEQRLGLDHSCMDGAFQDLMDPRHRLVLEVSGNPNEVGPADALELRDIDILLEDS